MAIPRISCGRQCTSIDLARIFFLRPNDGGAEAAHVQGEGEPAGESAEQDARGGIAGDAASAAHPKHEPTVAERGDRSAGHREEKAQGQPADLKAHLHPPASTSPRKEPEGRPKVPPTPV